MYEAILISENADETAILKTVLQQAGLSVQFVRKPNLMLPDDGQRMIRLIVSAIPITEMSSALMDFHGESRIPLLLISDPLSEEEHSRLLDTNVDLVVQRPFSSRLLISQIRALMRRMEGSIAQVNLPPLQLPGLVVDPATRTVIPNGQQLHKRLTHLEFQLLYTLLIYRGQVVPTERIIETVWGYNGQGDRQLVRGLVSRVRGKIEQDPKEPKLIITVPGIGYMFEVAEQ